MMKKLLLILVVLVGFAQVQAEVESDKNIRPWPRITVYPNSVEVWINNYDDRIYRCSGTVWMYFESGRSRSEFVSVTVFNRSFATRRIVNYNRDDRIRSANHTISCF